MLEVGCCGGSRDNIASFFKLQGHFARSAVLEDTPQHHAVMSMNIALGHALDSLLTLESRSGKLWKLLNFVTQYFTTRHGRRQHSKNSAGSSIGLGGGHTTLNSRIA